ncbi:MAG: helix-turn-helix domain-containing protein [Oscillospiraceae bacterium]
MRRSLWSTRDSVKDYFPLPKEIFSLGLSAAEIAIYAYLLFCEDRQTFKCWPSYRKIGEAVGLSPNTIRKHIWSLEERSLLITEPTLVTTKDGKARNGNLRFTIRPIQAALQQDYDRQMQKLDEDAARRKYADFIQNTGKSYSQNASSSPSRPCRRFVRLSGHSRARTHRKPQNRTLRRRAGALEKVASTERTTEGNSRFAQNIKKGKIERF